MALQFGPEDQRNINTFSKLNTELHELNAMMSIQQVCERIYRWRRTVVEKASTIAPPLCDDQSRCHAVQRGRS